MKPFWPLAICAHGVLALGRVFADSPIVFNEVHYHPQTNESAFEWVELQNQLSVDLDLSGWRIDGGIRFDFVEGTVLTAGSFMLVAKSPPELGAATGLTNIFGPFEGRLSNGGEVIELFNNNDRLIDEVAYGVGAEDDWPVAPDGAGPSLARRQVNLATANPLNWTASSQMGGTPGAENFPASDPPRSTNTLVRIDSTWRFDNTGTDLGTSWRESGFDDNNWSEGEGVFFHTDATLPAPKNTPLAPDRVTTYFRTSFVVTGRVDALQLQLQPLIDDGAVGYLNGAEVFRLNMPTGTIEHQTLANGLVTDAELGPPLILPVAQLREGVNVLAVEVHQAALTASYPAAVLDSMPIAYWRLDEVSGLARDSSPVAGAQTGSYAGLPPQSIGRPGPRPTDRVNGEPLSGFEANNLAPEFSGSNLGGNGVVTFLDNGLFNFSDSPTFSLEAWVKGASAQEPGAAIFAKGQGGGGEQFVVEVASGTYRFFVRDNSSSFTPSIAHSNVRPNDSWQHLVAVFDLPNRRMKLYVNGVEAASGSPGASLLDSRHEVSIGARKNTGSPSYDLNFNGRIDEAAIYDRALSAEEILAHFNAAFPGTSGDVEPDTTDLVFGMEIAVSNTLEPAQPRLVFNEVVSFTNAAFWLELINPGPAVAELGGTVIVRLDGQMDQEYEMPPRLLAPGEFVQLTEADLGFRAGEADRLILYGPGKSNVLDATVIREIPRARSPDAVGQWLFPSAATPGQSNTFAFHDEIVINEIMFHRPDLPAEAATFSPTNILVTLTNTWSYLAEGVELGSVWREPDFDDSAWPVGRALLYAPIANVPLPVPKNTFVPLTNRAGVRITTYYFRTKFVLSADLEDIILAFRPVVDDGAVFYLNGAEVLRLNLPATNITYNTLASANVGIPLITGPFIIPTTNLLAGVNSLAVEVHQASPRSPDFDFALEVLTWKQLTPELPFRESPEAWLELFNRSDHSVDLTGWQLTDAIDYTFESGQTIASGGYLVVAQDVEHFKSLYPSIDAVGPFDGKLSRRSDRILLLDPNRNPADVVPYFDRAPWPRYADGGGSSLELRDPRADNQRPEAWAASDVSARSEWHTYTWGGEAVEGAPGQPAIWHEFALCLLDGAGELLIDDVSIIQTFNETSLELVENGRFDGGSAAHWRFLGNHRHSRVKSDPDDPSNYVLHLVSSGPGEYMGNQIEMTLSNNIAALSRRDYQLSFRAKTIGGKAKLNARLYFNKLPRTFDLLRPELQGSPGRINSRSTPNIGPTFTGLSHSPVVPNPGEAVSVSVGAHDPDGIDTLTLHYSVAGGQWEQTVMKQAFNRNAEPVFRAGVPGQFSGDVVQFYVEGKDRAGAVALFPAGGTNSRALFAVQDEQALPGLHNLRVIMTGAEATYLHTATNTLSNELLGCTVIHDEREIFYDAGIRLKGSFVGRNVDRVGFHIGFPADKPFRGYHNSIAVDRSAHALVGGIHEMITRHIASHAGGIPNMYTDLGWFIAPIRSFTGISEWRLTGFGRDFLQTQFRNGADGSMFEIEGTRWNLATVNGDPEAPKRVGDNTGGTGYNNLEIQDYGFDKENYRWFFLAANNLTADDYSIVTNFARTFSQSGTNFDAHVDRYLDIDQWMRVMAFQKLVNPSDAYYTGGSIHNFRIYVRPEDRKVLYMPWDWDSAFRAPAGASIFGGTSAALLLNNPNNRRAYLHHMLDILTTTYNPDYLAEWIDHYGAVGRQDLTAILDYVRVRHSVALGQIPRGSFRIVTNSGRDFATSEPNVDITGAAPLTIQFIEVNGVRYPIDWQTDILWEITVPLVTGTNTIVVQGVARDGLRLPEYSDSFIITNTGPGAFQIAVINEWMASNTRTLNNVANGNQADDWFELYNPGTNHVDLSGYYLTDDLDVPTKFRIPEGYGIAPGGFLIVWADNAPHLNTNAATDLHASFQLAKGGEAIGLFAADGIPVDVVRFGPQISDLTEGRYPDGVGPARALLRPTPRAPNSVPVNTAPQLERIADQTLYFGETLVVSPSAIDAESALDDLRFFLDASPLGVALEPIGGRVVWTPTFEQAPSTNLFALRVSDDGIPQLDATQRFNVTVLSPPDLAATPSGSSFQFVALSNRTYTVQWKEALDYGEWTKLLDVSAEPGNRLETLHDPLPVASGRLYRLLTPRQPDPPPGPLILRSPRTTIVDAGQDVDLNVFATGNGALSYQWYFNGAMLQETTTPNLGLDHVQIQQIGEYTVTVTDSDGSATNRPPAILAVRPTILTHPESQQVTSGETVTFTVAAEALAPARYRWTFNGQVLRGQVEPTLSIPAVNLSDAGVYRVSVSHLTPLGYVGSWSRSVVLIVE